MLCRFGQAAPIVAHGHVHLLGGCSEMRTESSGSGMSANVYETFFVEKEQVRTASGAELVEDVLAFDCNGWFNASHDAAGGPPNVVW